MCIRDSFVAGHDQPGLATAKEGRKQLAKAAVDRIVRGLQKIPCFAVDASNRILQRFHRLGQICRLRVEVALALARRLEFVEGGQVDRTEGVDRPLQRGNRTLQRACSGADEVRRQSLLVGIGGAQLARELLAIAAGCLFLQFALADPVAQWVKALLDP